MRKIYIVPADYDEIKAVAEAVIHGTGEVVRGIPPALKGLVSNNELPCIYLEPEKPPMLPSDIDALKTKCANLETVTNTLTSNVLSMATDLTVVKADLDKAKADITALKTPK